MTREEQIKQAAIEIAKDWYCGIEDEFRSKVEKLEEMGRWADEHPKKIPTRLDVFNQLTFDVNFPQFSKEACENCVGGAYSIVWNILRSLIAQVSIRASELNDPVLNALMIKLNLYEMANEERRPTIKKLQEIFEGKEN